MPVAAIIPVVAAVAGLAGTGLSLAAGAKSASALNAARTAEAARQADLNRQALGVANARINAATPQTATAQINQGADNRTATAQQLASASTPIASALPATSGTATSGAQKRTAAAGNAWNILNTANKAREGAYGDWQTQQGVANEGAADKLAVLRNFSGADAALQPTEQQVALNSGDQLGAWGNIVSSLGQVAAIGSRVGAFGRSSAPGMTPAGQVMNYPGTAGMLNGIQQNARATAGNGQTDVWTNLFKR